MQNRDVELGLFNGHDYKSPFYADVFTVDRHIDNSNEPHPVITQVIECENVAGASILSYCNCNLLHLVAMPRKCFNLANAFLTKYRYLYKHTSIPKPPQDAGFSWN